MPGRKIFYDDINRYVLVLPPMARGEINLNFPVQFIFLVLFESPHYREFKNYNLESATV